MAMVSLLQSLLLIATLGATNVLGTVFDGAASVPTNVDYDFVVVGGGTAGGVIANRLSENPRVKVLLLEAGIPNTDVDLQIPFLCSTLNPNTKWDWNYTTEGMPGLGGRSITYARGYTLGGSSSINFMAYTRGTKEDYDRIAKITGDNGWNWNSMLNFFKKVETFTAPAERSGDFIPSVHGTSGPLGVGLATVPFPTDERVIGVTKEQPETFPFNQDINSGDHIGIGWFPYSIKEGHRTSSGTAYLNPFESRSNLHVVTRARVLKLQYKNTKSGLEFKTVQFGDKRGGKTFTVTASKEVILSAGSLNTPQILMNSGIGDPVQLLQNKIVPLVPLPSVGKNISDHPLSTIHYTVNSQDTLEQFRDPAFAALQNELWQKNGTGFLTAVLTNQVGFLRLPSDHDLLKNNADPSAGPKSAHFEFLFTNGFLGPPQASGNFFSITGSLLTPTSRGFVQLRSNNPWDPPKVTPNFLGTQFDREMHREAMKIAQKFVSADAWKDWIIAPVENLETDAQIDEHLRNTVAPFFHPTGSAAMSPANANYGVVNPDLKVKRVNGLRIVDASVFPFIPTAHTQAPVYGIAERAADLIKKAWRI